MLTTELARAWGLSIPIIGAPMFPAAGGKLAAALSNAGALGMMGVGSTQSVDAMQRDVAECRALAPERPFGIGLMTWAVDRRPELLEAAIALRPFAIALSFGDLAKYVAPIRASGARVVSQVQDRETAVAAERAGADVIVAQGTEAGGHTGAVGTLPLLQIVLDVVRVRVPVVAAGGIATGRGLAAVLAAGAQAAWIGTPFLVAEEARTSARARERIASASERDTVHTHVFDVAQDIPWPDAFPGRALRNDFTARWHGRESELAADGAAKASLRQAKDAEDFSQAFIYAGQAVGMIEGVRPAAVIAREIAEGAEARLKELGALIR